MRAGRGGLPCVPCRTCFIWASDLANSSACALFMVSAWGVHSFLRRFGGHGYGRAGRHDFADREDVWVRCGFVVRRFVARLVRSEPHAKGPPHLCRPGWPIQLGDQIASLLGQVDSAWTSPVSPKQERHGGLSCGVEGGADDSGVLVVWSRPASEDCPKGYSVGSCESPGKTPMRMRARSNAQCSSLTSAVQLC